MERLAHPFVVAFDGSAPSVIAAAAAADAARRWGPPLHLIAVLGHHRAGTHGESRVRSDVLSAADRLANGGARPVTHIRIGSPAEEIDRLAREIGASLIVVGHRRPGGVRHGLLGDVAERLARRSETPILVCALAEEGWPPRHVLVAQDESGAAAAAESAGAVMAALYEVPLTIVESISRVTASQPALTSARDPVLAVQEARLHERATLLRDSTKGHVDALLVAGGLPHALAEASADGEGARPILTALGRQALGALSHAVARDAPIELVPVTAGSLLVVPSGEHPHLFDGVLTQTVRHLTGRP